MALFKSLRGKRENLPTTKTDGYAYFCTDDGSFHIDYEDDSGIIQRKQINAKDAETLTGASLSTILNSSDIEIPTSKAVSDQITAVINELKNGDIKSAVDRIAVLDGKSHEHANKALLDTYTQTEADLADAVAKKHSHANKAELDKIVSGDKVKWDAAVQTVTAGTGLTATKTGTDVAIGFDDTVTFIFDCGNASV